LANRSAALAALSAGLLGRPVPAHQAVDAISLANQSLITPLWSRALKASGAFHALDPDLQAFLDDVCERNVERNQRLQDQLADAVAALNKAGIRPVLLKGSAVAALCAPEADDRILADLDLLVRPTEAGAALEALREAGFPVLAQYPGDAVHVVAELGRPTDVGPIDLHQRPPGPPGMAEPSDLRERCVTVIIPNGGEALVPCPELQIYFLMLHDQFHDGDFWRGGFDMRHLVDIALLSRRGVDWDYLKSLCRTKLVWNALGAQLVAARRFAGAAIPASATGFFSQVHHIRHLEQYRRPFLALPLAFFGAVIEALNLLEHRRTDKITRDQILTVTDREQKRSSTASRIKDIMTGGSGKI